MATMPKIEVEVTAIPPRRTVFTANARLAIQRFSKPAGADKPAEGVTLVGYPIIWGALSADRGGYQVRLLKGSANFTDPAMALFNHDFKAVIGNTQNATLRIIPDDVGVKVEIDLPDTSTGRDVAELVGKRYVQGMSFCMTEAPDFKMAREGGTEIMEVSKFTADEVTVTAIPAFVQTSIDIAPAAKPAEPAAVPQAVPQAVPLAAAKNSAGEVNHRRDQAQILQRMKLAALAEFE